MKQLTLPTDTDWYNIRFVVLLSIGMMSIFLADGIGMIFFAMADVDVIHEEEFINFVSFVWSTTVLLVFGIWSTKKSLEWYNAVIQTIAKHKFRKAASLKNSDNKSALYLTV